MLEKFAAKVTGWAEKWFPDSYIFAVLAVLLVSLGAAGAGIAPISIVRAFGDGFWSLIPFTLQMAMVVISGYVVAASSPVEKLIKFLTKLPRTEKSAVAYIAFFTIVASLFNWALSLVFGGLYVRALARRNDLRIDYRAAGAAGYLGLGATWALGLSSSAAQLQANAGSIPSSLLPISGVIPFSETIFLPQSLLLLVILTLVSVFIAYASAPGAAQSITASELGINLEEELHAKDTLTSSDTRVRLPSEWLEHSPVLTLLIAALGIGWIISEFAAKNSLIAISNLNNYNFIFLILGMLFSWRPRNFLNAVQRAVPSISGLLLQFPLYGSIAYILTSAKNAQGDSLSHLLSQFFISISTEHSYSVLMGIYSAVLGFFIPSGGGKWIIEAPYLLQAANSLHVHLGWTVMVYNAAEALPNLINPFFMVALLGVLGLRARDIVGYTVTQLVVHAPLVLFLLWALGQTLIYHPPLIP